jgi:hypothetical protein
MDTSQRGHRSSTFSGRSIGDSNGLPHPAQNLAPVGDMTKHTEQYSVRRAEDRSTSALQ